MIAHAGRPSLLALAGPAVGSGAWVTEPASAQDLVRWGEALAGIAKTGLGFTDSLYERERFEEVLNVAGDIRAAAASALARDGQPVATSDADGLVREWLPTGRPGRGRLRDPEDRRSGRSSGNEEGQILLVQRADSGRLAVPDRLGRRRLLGGRGRREGGPRGDRDRGRARATGHGAGWPPTRFHAGAPVLARVPPAERGRHAPGTPARVRRRRMVLRGSLPSPLAGAGVWSAHAFAAIRGEPVDVLFDWPRRPVWRKESGSAAECTSSQAGTGRYTRSMDDNDLVVERVSAASEELVEAMARLVPQLSSSAAAPDLADLEQVATAPGARCSSRGTPRSATGSSGRSPSSPTASRPGSTP